MTDYERGVEDMRKAVLDFLEKYVERGKRERKTARDSEDRAFLSVLNDQAQHYINCVSEMKVKYAEHQPGSK